MGPHFHQINHGFVLLYPKHKTFYDCVKLQRKGSVKQSELYRLNKRVMYLVRYRNLISLLCSHLQKIRFMMFYRDKLLKSKFSLKLSILRQGRKKAEVSVVRYETSSKYCSQVPD